MHHVIVGNGPAGTIAAETLRKLDPQSHVSLVGDEGAPPYSRMAIPYFLVGQIDETGTYLRKDAAHFDRQGIERVEGRVASVDPGKQSVALDDGRALEYDRLLVATGSRPVRPPIPGMDLPGVHPCWTLGDARAIIERAKPGARVVLVGAGFIGCIILEALASRGTKLTVVEMEPRMVARMMNDTAAGLLRNWCEREGVGVRTGARVAAVQPGTDSPLVVELESGEAIPADLVITATGVRPNLEFLEGAGITTDQGVLVNRHMETSTAGIYAAGDVAQGLDFSTGQYSVQAIQPTAADHAQIAAYNMVGLERVHRGNVNMNVLATLGLVSTSFGLWMGLSGGDSAELCDADRFRYINLQFEDDRLVGASSLGLTDHVGVIRGLIQTKVSLGPWKAKLEKDPTRLMEAYIARTQPLGYNASVV